MPDIALLEPQVLRGVVEQLNPQETLVLSNLLPRSPWPYPSVTWDVIKASRQVARPNVPNSEAHIVPRLGVSQQAAAFVYLREKKVFEPTTLYWLRQPGSLAARNAEAAVLREVTDLNYRFDNFLEWMCWQALTGTLVLDYEDVRTSVSYQIASSHKPTVGVGWGTATTEQIRADINAWKLLVQRDGRVPATDVWLTTRTFDHILRAFSNAATTLLSDRMRDQFFQTGTMTGFLGLDWHPTDHIYTNDAGDTVQFLKDDALVFGNLDTGRPMEIMEGPTADDEAPDYFTGKFTKTWKEKDPSARQVLLEWNVLPIITRPDQIVYVDDVNP